MNEQTYVVSGMLYMATVGMFEPNGFLRLERLTKHPVGQDTVGHGWEENLLGQLKKVVLSKALARHEGGPKATASILKIAPVSFLLLLTTVPFSEYVAHTWLIKVTL